ncbi:MAG TPA: galactokinase [Pyrinomonadaceae bacterium]
MSDNRERTFRAPGRVNLIGEHTDYNDGFVMPAALNFSTFVTISPLPGRVLQVFSENFNKSVSIDFNTGKPKPRGDWSDYVVGVAVMLQDAGYVLGGAKLKIRGEVPIGSGLSSSAAIEVASACALIANSNITIDRVELAKLCRRAENEFVGARVGIMDQFISLHGRAKKALLLDCRSLEYELLPLSSEAHLVVCNTMVKHKLASGEYNERRAQCEAGVKHLSQTLPHVTALRDVTLEQLEAHGKQLPDVIYRRCRHVVTENARVLEAGEALKRGDLRAFGKLMYESHRSLRDDYEVSCPELDVMVELASKIEGVYGARMTGGGFGGCTVNLVANEHVDEFTRTVANGYEQKTKLKPEIFVCETADGAGEVTSVTAAQQRSGD